MVQRSGAIDLSLAITIAGCARRLLRGANGQGLLWCKENWEYRFRDTLP